MVNPSCIDGGAACADLGVQHLGEFEEHVEAFLRAYSVSSGNDDWRAFEVMFCLFHMSVEHAYDILRLGDIFRHVVAHHFCGIVLVENLFLHHALAHRSHLRAVFGVDDGSDDVSAESWSYLIELLLVVFRDEFSRLVLHLHVEVSDFEFGAVGGESAEQCRGDTRAEVTSDDGSAHEADLRFLLFEEVDDEGCMRV